MTRQPKKTKRSASSPKPLPVVSEKALGRIRGGLGFFQQSAAHGDETGSSGGTFI